MTWRVPLKDVANFYDSKTQAVLHRYGPGPRVHYHAGLFDSLEPIESSPAALKQRLVNSQERILRYAAQLWGASTHLNGEVLDAGCGLGGGSLFWAQEFGAQVTAVTIASSHIPLINQFAAQAGVSSRVHPQVCNVVEMPGENRFDAAVAIESSCHMPRVALFDRLASLIRPGGRVFIADYFFEQTQYEELWREHWQAPIGTVNEYCSAAQAAGFQVNTVKDISPRTEHFWTMTSALIQIEANQQGQNNKEPQKIGKSFRAHSMVRDGLVNGGLHYALMSFVNSN